ncbi:MAG: PAS domain S-box protein, partial [Hyphomicrobiales bacterium]|nr:PAS domain S-box protein [Hyphomicrobiales bacterium]
MSASKSPDSPARATRASSGTSKSPKASAGTIASFADDILDGLAEGFFALDAGWRFIAFNRAAEEAFGLKREDLIGRDLWEVSPATRGTEFERRYRLVMTNREKQVFEARPTREPERWHEVRAFPLGAGIGVAFRDVTEDKAALERLRERERELSRAQEIGRLGGIRIDLRQGFIVRRSPEYLRLYGFPREAAIEDHERWSQRLHPDDRERAVDRFFSAVASDAKEYASEYRIIRPSDGAVRWIRSVGEFERDERGKALGLIGAHIDITELKLAEQEARESQAQFLAIADALPVLISYVDKDQVYRFVNKTYEIWFERPSSEIIGRRVEEVMIPAMYEARRPYLERALAGEAQSYEVDFIRSGGPIATEVVHVPHRDASGLVLGVYAIVADISNRKLAERKAAESEARFRAIADSAPAMMWVTGADGRREFVNRAYLDFFGGSYEEALFFDWRRLLHPEDRPRLLSEEPRIDASVKTVTIEARFRRSDGMWRWLRSVSQPRWSPEGEHTGFIGAAYDITEAKQAQEELTRINETLEKRVAERTAQLAASEALVRTFFQHSSDIHVVLVEDGDSFRFQEANPAALRVYGRPREAVVGHSTEEVFGREAFAEVDRHLSICLRQGATHRYEVKRGAVMIEAVASPVPVRPREPRRLVVSAHDITERRRLEEQLRQSQKMEALGQLTGGVAHDFNNLLTLILGGLDTIDRQMTQVPGSPAKARIERAREMALQGVQRARGLTARLLAFSRRQTLTPQSVDANALV